MMIAIPLPSVTILTEYVMGFGFALILMWNWKVIEVS